MVAATINKDFKPQALTVFNGGQVVNKLEVKVMADYEGLILARQESESDECTTCPYKGMECENQCMEIELHYNPWIQSHYTKGR